MRAQVNTSLICCWFSRYFVCGDRNPFQAPSELTVVRISRRFGYVGVVALSRPFLSTLSLAKMPGFFSLFSFNAVSSVALSATSQHTVCVHATHQGRVLENIFTQRIVAVRAISCLSLARSHHAVRLPVSFPPPQALSSPRPKCTPSIGARLVALKQSRRFSLQRKMPGTR